MKLFAVTAQVMVVVQAESEKGAISDAGLYVAQAACDGVDIDSADEILSAADLPPGWTVADIPFGGDGSARIGTILADMPPIVVRDTRTIDMFEAQP
jgi:hypothetical protein